jgi:hypothetical protein
VTTALRRPTALPNGAVLLHVGPHKTGTTALQGALWAAREKLHRQDVRLAGRSRNPASAVRAVTGQASPYADDGRTPPLWRWRRLAGDIRGARESRVVVSSEFFAWAGDDAITRIADDVGRNRVHVAVTLRPLARVIPSMWQQNVQAGTVATIDEWLRVVLDQAEGQSRHPFWTLHRHDELIDRWAAIIGAERVTGVVVDDRDHDVLMRAFEQLLDLEPGTLVPQIDLLNRSLTLPEAEAVRAFNRAFHAKGLSRGRHARLMRFGAAQVMKQRPPSRDERRVELPGWAGEPIEAIQRDIVAAIGRSGARILGDLERLVEPAGGRMRYPAPEAPASGTTASSYGLVPPDAAAAMAMGIVVAAGEGRASRGGGRLELAEPMQVVDVPTHQLVAVLVLRTWRRGVRLVDRAAARLRRLATGARPLVEP